MNAIYKVIFGLIALHYLTNAYANNALYKIMPLDDIHSLYASGNVSIEIEYGVHEQAEIYLRANGINDIVISTEEKNAKDKSREPFKVLRIREQPATTDPVNEDTVLAHIKLTLSKLNYIFTRDLHQLSINNNYQNAQKVFSINLTGDSRADIGLNFDTIRIKTSGTSVLSANKLQASSLDLHSRMKSKVTITDSEFILQKIKTSHASEFVQANSQAQTIKITAFSSSTAEIDSSNLISTAEIASRHKSKVAFSPSGLDIASVETKQTSEVTLGEVAALDLRAKDNSLVTYQTIDQEASTIVNENQAKVQQRASAYE
jgi:hypothetical protein